MNTQKRPLVSVIVPVYNVERYIDECLDSIRNQTYERLEIIVVEDCSTDGSLAKLEPHLADPRVRLLRHKKNSGLSAARNTGIEAATGDFFLFVDSDDAIAPALVEASLSQAQETGADVVVFDFIAFKDGEELPKLSQIADNSSSKSLDRIEYFKLPHFAWLKFIRAELLRDQRLRFPVGLYYEDWPFHWELGFSSALIHHLDGQWYCYRQRGTSITASMGRKLLDQFAVQHMVLETVRERGGEAELTALSSKVYLTFWGVLTRIDSNLISEAIGRAKNLQSELRSLGSVYPQCVKAALMGAVLSLPYTFTKLGVCSVRGIKALPTFKKKVLGKYHSSEVS